MQYTWKQQGEHRGHKQSIELKTAISFQFRATVTPKLGAGSSGTSQNLESANTPRSQESVSTRIAAEFRFQIPAATGKANIRSTPNDPKSR